MTTNTHDPTWQAGLAIRRWAVDHNILYRGPRMDVPVDEEVAAAAAVALSSGSEDILDRRDITAISVNSAARTVYIYTRLRVTKKETKILPTQFGGEVSVEYRIARPLAVGQEAGDLMTDARWQNDRAQNYCGGSIGHGNARAAGTLGALVRDKKGKLYGLSCNHVTGGCNNARVGLPVVAPGIMDVMAKGNDPRTIGYHHRTLPLVAGEPDTVDHKKNTDAAIFEVADPQVVSSSQGGVYPTPTDVTAPVPGMKVEKVGRTTGHTVGFIEGEHVGPLPLEFKIQTFHSAHEQVSFQGMVYFEPVFICRADTGVFGGRGDSGALVVTRDDEGHRQAVGILFAGGDGAGHAYILPLAPILKRLKVQLITGHNDE